MLGGCLCHDLVEGVVEGGGRQACAADAAEACAREVLSDDCAVERALEVLDVHARLVVAVTIVAGHGSDFASRDRDSCFERVGCSVRHAVGCRGAVCAVFVAAARG